MVAADPARRHAAAVLLHRGSRVADGDGCRLRARRPAGRGSGLDAVDVPDSIVYPASMVPDRFKWVLAVNPMSHLVEAYRGAVLDDRVPALAPLAVLAAIALVVFVSKYWAFTRSKHAFADLL